MTPNLWKRIAKKYRYRIQGLVKTNQSLDLHVKVLAEEVGVLQRLMREADDPLDNRWWKGRVIDATVELRKFLWDKVPYMQTSMINAPEAVIWTALEYLQRHQPDPDSEPTPWYNELNDKEWNHQRSHE